MGADEYARYLVAISILGNMSDEERSMFVRFMQDEERKEALLGINNRFDGVEALVRKENSFTKNVLSNVVGNYIADGSIYLLSKLLKSIKL